jgi:hypothetical protein
VSVPLIRPPVDESKFIKRKMGKAAPGTRTKKDNPIVLKRFTHEQKLQAVTTYSLLGNMVETSRVTGIGLMTLKMWKRSPWFKDMLNEVRKEDIEQCGAKMQRIIHKAIAVVEERVEKGNYVFDQKTGLMQRIPVNVKDALKVTTEMMDRHEKIFSNPKTKDLEEAIDARLSRLAEEFSRFAKAKEVKQEPQILNVIEQAKESCPS